MIRRERCYGMEYLLVFSNILWFYIGYIVGRKRANNSKDIKIPYDLKWHKGKVEDEVQDTSVEIIYPEDEIMEDLKRRHGF